MIEWGQFGEKALEFIQRPISEDARITILEGSVRSGKTVALIPKWLQYMLEGPAGLLLMAGVSKDTIYDNVLRDLFDTIGSDNYSYNRQSGDLVCFGRNIKVIGAKDEGSEKYLRGKTLAGAYVDEGSLMPENFFKQLLNRMSVEGAKLYLTTNPDSPFHYLNADYITSEDKLANGSVRVIHFELEDNPNLSEEYVSFIKSAYTGLFYKRFIQGLWVQAEGAIYDCWSTENEYHYTNESDKLPVLKGYWEKAVRDIAIDYGTTNPMCFLDIYNCGDKILVHNEYYWDSKKQGKQKTDGEYADDLGRFCGGPDAVRFIVLDPSAASFRIELIKRGYRVKEADNEVLDGIRLTGSLIATRRLMVNKPKCPNLLKEINSYVWDTKPAEKKGIEKPVKVMDHACDSLRYYCYSIIKINRAA